MVPKPKTDSAPVRIDVWSVDWRGVDVEAGIANLSGAERARLASLRGEDRRRQYVAARQLAYRALAARLGRRAQEVTIAAAGAPALRGLDGRAGLGLAHCAGLAVCALSLDGAVGIDCESERTANDRLGIARRYFSAAEYNALRQPDGLAHFNAMWTVKEAVAKARGGSVLDCLATVVTVPLPGGGYTVTSTDTAVAGRVVLWRRNGAQLALFVPGAITRPDVVLHDGDVPGKATAPDTAQCIPVEVTVSPRASAGPPRTAV